MKASITPLSVIPLRAEPSHRSEMVSQILFGERLIRREENGDFVQVIMEDTAYEGWVQRSQLVDADLSQEIGIVGLEEVYASDGRTRTQLYPGTPIYGERITLGAEHYEIVGDIRIPVLSDFVDEYPRLIDYYLRTPYLWGGRTVAGIDCSGFSQVVFRHFGISIKRDAYQQAEAGVSVDFISEIKAGDLAFFDNDSGRINHVGVMVDSDTIIHASGEVRIDKLDQQGIYDPQSGKYSHRLRIVKRYF